MSRLAPPRDLYLGEASTLRFAHAPWREDGLWLLSDAEAELLARARGKRWTREELAAAVAGAAPIFDRLAARGLLEPEEGAPPPPARERAFNVWVHLSNDCNLACPHCFVDKSPAPMSAVVRERLLGAIEATARGGAVDRVHLRFAGGEPMLAFDALKELFFAATERCRPHGVAISGALITNGTVVPRGATDFLRAHGFSVSVSIDGLGAAQDAMRPTRGGRGSAAQLERGLEAYLAAGLAPYALVTVGAQNLAELPELVEGLLARGLSFRLSLLKDLERPSAGSSAALERALDESYARIEARAWRGALPRGFRRSHRFCDLELWRPITRACGAGASYLAVGHAGRSSACHIGLSWPDAGALDDARALPEQAAAQAQWRPFHRDEDPESCRRCAFRASCAGGCPLVLFLRDGHTNGRSPFCRVFKRVIPAMLRVAAIELAGEERLSSLEAHRDPDGSTDDRRTGTIWS